MNSACRVAGDNIRMAAVAVAGALRATASPAGKKHNPTRQHERYSLKSIASSIADGPQRQTSLVPNYRVAWMETRANGYARVRQRQLLDNTGIASRRSKGNFRKRQPGRQPMSRLKTETVRNHQTMSERQALFRRFGYDSAASLKFILAKVLPLPGCVLEIGTGKGGFLAQLGKHADHITTLDIDAGQQRLAKRHVRQAGPRCPIRYVIRDAERLHWADGTFDSVVSVNTFHHLKRPTRVLKEMLRVLRPGGKLVLCDLSPRGFQIFDRIHRFESGTHPRLKHGLAEFGRLLRRPGWKTKRFKGYNQDILVATTPPVPTKTKNHK
jgi:ubiquinone/menaquinone biosynthesis C-methylase UbiE